MLLCIGETHALLVSGQSLQLACVTGTEYYGRHDPLTGDREVVGVAVGSGTSGGAGGDALLLLRHVGCSLRVDPTAVVPGKNGQLCHMCARWYSTSLTKARDKLQADQQATVSVEVQGSPVAFTARVRSKNTPNSQLSSVRDCVFAAKLACMN